MDFWFEYACTYSYLAAERVEAVAGRAGVPVTYRPFLLGPIFKSQGWETSPFNIYEAKGRYMWRDVERSAAELDIPFQRPSVFPRNGLLAARVTVALAERGPVVGFVREVYRAGFARNEDTSEAPVLTRILDELGVEAGPVLDAASTDTVKQQLRAQTDEAIARGIFGSPSFTIDDELFWGNDRLDAAVRWAARARPAAGGACGFPNDF